MKESKWLKEYEKEVKDKREASNKNKKVILIIIPIMMLLFVGAAMLNSDIATAQGQESIGFIAVIFIVIMIFAIVMISVGKKKDVTKKTRENVMSLLRGDEEVDSFDQQMSVVPIKEVKVSNTTTIFLTQDYIGKKYIDMGDFKYSFIHRNEIVSYNYAKTASTTGNPINAAFFFDIRDSKKKVIMNGLADSGSQLAELEELLRIAQPTIKKG